MLMSKMMMASGGSFVSTWNPADKSVNVSLSNNNFDAQGNVDVWDTGIRGIVSHSSGHFYFEINSILEPLAGKLWVGVANSSADLTASPSTSTDAWQADGDGHRNNPFTASFFATFAAGDVIGFEVEWGAVNRVNFTFNGANAKDHPVSISGQTLFPAAWPRNHASLTKVGLVTTPPFTHSIPAGADPWG